MRIRIYIIVLISLLGCYACWTISARGGASGGAGYYFFEKGYVPDAFQYQIPAANLALHGSYPYYGIIGDVNEYRLCAQPDSNVYFRDIARAGVSVFVSKPPLYSYLLGRAYKIWGYCPDTARAFNACCYILVILLMVLTGAAVAGTSGMLTAILAAFLFLAVNPCRLWNYNAEILTMCLVMVVCYTSALAMRYQRWYLYLLSGLSMSLLILCKGYFMLTAIVFLGYLLYRWLYVRRAQDGAGALLMYTAGTVALIGMWAIYINPLLRHDIANRNAFSQYLESVTPRVELGQLSDAYDSSGRVRRDVAENINLFHEYQQARENDPILVSNQMGRYNILNVHNEFCTDGDFHPEWRIIRSSFYNRHRSESKNTKLWLFYSQNPMTGLKISVAKLKNISSVSGWCFYLACLTMLAMIIWRLAPVTMSVAAIFIATIFATLIIFYGDIRFVQSIEPVSILVLSAGAAHAVEYLRRSLKRTA